MSDLQKRLLASREVTIGHWQTETVFRNPDGPEAAARITALEAEVDALREALNSLDNLTARDAAIVAAALAGGD